MNDKNCMKTMHYLKWTKYIAVLYMFFCLFSIIMFVIHDYAYSVYNNRELFGVAILTLYLWMTNPMVLIVSMLGLKTYLIERKDMQKRNHVKRKWIAFVLWNVICFIVWMISVCCFVHITGGV